MNFFDWHVAVLIPARNEEELIGRCLRSVQKARQCLPYGVTSDLIVVSDCSSDRTHAIAESIIDGTGVIVHSTAGVVGAARALAGETALQRLKGCPERCWLANTDGDCEVPATWLSDQLDIAAGGIEAIAGIVDVDSFAEHDERVKGLFRRTYRVNSDGTHPHVHGANLGVRADAYLRAGGWRNVATGEDHDLWERLQIGGHSRLSNSSLRVMTSGRRVGRAPLGFADALAAHNEAAA